MEEKNNTSTMAIAKENMHVNVKFSRKENELVARVAALEGRSKSNYIRFVVLRDAEFRDRK